MDQHPERGPVSPFSFCSTRESAAARTPDRSAHPAWFLPIEPPITCDQDTPSAGVRLRVRRLLFLPVFDKASRFKWAILFDTCIFKTILIGLAEVILEVHDFLHFLVIMRWLLR